MAVKTTAQSGNWSDTSTWVGGVLPVDGDSIAAGNDSHVLTLDVDITGWTTGLAASTWIGTLRVSQTAGTYGIKFAGTFTNNGVVNVCGATLTDPLPSDVQVNFTSTANTSMFAGNGVYNIRCAEPVRPWSTLKTAVNAGATKLYVDHSLEEGEWTVGRFVRVDNVNRNVQSEEMVIASVGSDGGGDFITFTTGLASAKIVGTMVILTSRNIQATGNSGSAQHCFNSVNNQTLGLGIRNFNRALNSSNANTFTNSTLSGNTYALYSSNANTFNNSTLSGNSNALYSSNANTFNNSTLSGNSSALNSSNANTFTGSTLSGNSSALNYSIANTFNNSTLSGNTNAINGSNANTFNNSTLSGNTTALYNGSANTFNNSTLSGNTNALNGSNANTFTGSTLSGNSSALNYSIANTFNNSTLSGNTYHVRRSASNFKNCTFGAGVKYFEQTALYLHRAQITESIDDQGVPGGYSARTAGGEISRVGGTGPLTHTCKDATAPCFTQKQIHLPPNRTLRASTTGTRSTSSIACELQLLDIYLDPLVTNNNNDYLARDIATSDTDTLTVSYTNTSTQSMDIYVRVSAMAASGTYEQTTTYGIDAGINPSTLLDNYTYYDWDGEKSGTYSIQSDSTNPQTYTFYFSQSGIPKTNLSPSFASFKDMENNVEILELPTITELGNGYYKFEYKPLVPILVIIDSNDETMSSISRYRTMRLDPVIPEIIEIKELNETIDGKIDVMDGEIIEIKTQTDKIKFNDENDVISTLDGEQVSVNHIDDDVITDAVIAEGAISVDLEDIDITEQISGIDGKIDLIKSKTDNLPNDPASETNVSTRLAANDYTAPDNTGITDIKTQTDKMNFTGTDIKATLDSETVAVGDKTGFSLISAYDPAKNAATQSSMDIVDGIVDAIKLKTDLLPSDPASDTTVLTRLAAEDYAPFEPDPDIADIKQIVEKIQFTDDNDIKATLDDEYVVVETNLDKTGYELSQDARDNLKLDVIDAAERETGHLDIIKTHTDKIKFNDENDVISTLDGEKVSVDHIDDDVITDAVIAEGAIKVDLEDIDITEQLTGMDEKIDGIKAKTDNLPNDPASETNVLTRLAADDYVPFEPDPDVSVIKGVVEKIKFNAQNDVISTLDGENAVITNDQISDIKSGLATSDEIGELDEKIDNIQEVIIGGIPTVEEIVSGILSEAIDGTVDLQTALKEILAVTVNNFEYENENNINKYSFKNRIGDETVITHEINEEGTERNIS